MPIGRSGSDSPARGAAQRGADRADGLVLADDPPVQALLHVDELLDLALQQAADRDARPAGHDLGDVLGGDLLLEVLRLRRVGALAGLGLAQLLLEVGDLAVAQARRASRSAARSAWASSRCAVSSRSRIALTPWMASFLGLPLGLHRGRLLGQLGQLALERVAARDGRVVLLLGQRGQLDLQLHDAAVDLVDLGRHAVDLDAQPGGRLVDQVDRLVGQEAVGDVAVRERRGGDDRVVADRDAVVVLVALLEAAEDRDRVLDAGLAHEHGLEAALERGVLLDVLAVLVERGRAHRAQLAAGEHRLEEDSRRRRHPRRRPRRRWCAARRGRGSRGRRPRRPP